MDGGISWIIQRSGATNSLNAVCLASATNGIAVGSNGIILRTTDGGTTWTQQPGGMSSDLTP